MHQWVYKVVAMLAHHPPWYLCTTLLLQQENERKMKKNSPLPLYVADLIDWALNPEKGQFIQILKNCDFSLPKNRLEEKIAIFRKCLLHWVYV